MGWLAPERPKGWLRAASWQPATATADGVSRLHGILQLPGPSQQPRPSPKAHEQLVLCGRTLFALTVTMKWTEGRQNRATELFGVSAEEAALLALFVQLVSQEACLTQQYFRQPPLGWGSAPLVAFALRNCIKTMLTKCLLQWNRAPNLLEHLDLVFLYSFHCDATY